MVSPGGPRPHGRTTAPGTGGEGVQRRGIWVFGRVSVSEDLRSGAKRWGNGEQPRVAFAMHRSGVRNPAAPRRTEAVLMLVHGFRRCALVPQFSPVHHGRTTLVFRGMRDRGRKFADFARFRTVSFSIAGTRWLSPSGGRRGESGQAHAVHFRSEEH